MHILFVSNFVLGGTISFSRSFYSYSLFFWFYSPAFYICPSHPRCLVCIFVFVYFVFTFSLYVSLYFPYISFWENYFQWHIRDFVISLQLHMTLSDDAIRLAVFPFSAFLCISDVAYDVDFDFLLFGLYPYLICYYFL